MPLYTFIMDYRGGTYISQLRAPTPLSALRAWARRLDESEVWGMGKAGKDKLLEEMLDDINVPVPVSGVKHTWCSSALVRNQHMGINFVQTEEL